MMLELAVLMVVLLVGAVILTTLAVVGILFKVFFKLLLIPLVAVGWLLKAALTVVAGLALLIILGPIVLGAGLVVVLPLLVLAGIIWGAVAAFSPA